MALFLALFPEAISALKKFMSSWVVKFYPSSAVLKDLLLPEPGEEKCICARAHILYYGGKGVEMLDCVSEIN